MKKKDQTAAKLIQFYRRRGYMRKPNEDRFEEGSKAYKKGWEIRFSIDGEEEMAAVQKMLDELGFRHGKTYLKSNREILPVYGYEQVERFETLLSTHPAES